MKRSAAATALKVKKINKIQLPQPHTELVKFKTCAICESEIGI